MTLLANKCLPPTSFLFTLDVESLFTSIPTALGVATIKKFLSTHPCPKRPDNLILDLLDINLTRNDFIFNNKCYLQVSGSAMGKRFSPAYANLFMADLEAKAIDDSPLKPFLWFRFIDDVFGVWTHDLDNFVKFVKHLNSINSNIKFTSNYNDSDIVFLDLKVSKVIDNSNNCSFNFTVNFKNTDNHKLLNRRSYHPQSIFTSITYSQILRFARISSTKSSFDEACSACFAIWNKCGY